MEQTDKVQCSEVEPNPSLPWLYVITLTKTSGMYAAYLGPHLWFNHKSDACTHLNRASA